MGSPLACYSLNLNRLSTAFLISGITIEPPTIRAIDNVSLISSSVHLLDYTYHVITNAITTS